MLLIGCFLIGLEESEPLYFSFFPRPSGIKPRVSIIGTEWIR